MRGQHSRPKCSYRQALAVSRIFQRVYWRSSEQHRLPTTSEQTNSPQIEKQAGCLRDLWRDIRRSREAQAGDTDSSAEDPDDSLFEISKEFGMLEKIKDIIDELQMLLQVVDQQDLALEMLGREQPDTPKQVRGHLNPSELRQRALQRRKLLSNLDQKAGATYEAVNLQCTHGARSRSNEVIDCSSA